ncbi:MAG: hypothetical protein Udaeo2_07630 [Candidatus Udaeobacter sp.]|nr:MAG: hypothetical protein Udaeo2_07630 [Candidatus Udaeobacter sp.]
MCAIRSRVIFSSFSTEPPLIHHSTATQRCGYRPNITNYSPGVVVMLRLSSKRESFERRSQATNSLSNL